MEEQFPSKKLVTGSNPVSDTISKNMKKIICSKCNHEFRNQRSNFNRHFASCNGSYKPFQKLSSCKYCDLNFETLSASQRANHSRWCSYNPRSIEDKNQLSKRILEVRKQNKGKPLTIEHKEKIKEAHKNGKYSHVLHNAFLGRKHTDKAKQLIREKALSSSHRRLKKGMIEYNGIMLDSSWELELAKRLDYLQISWIRPLPIQWRDSENQTHKYFPDFYLPAYDLYLDPKNPYAVKTQQNKIEILKSLYNNIIFLYTLKECKEFDIIKK